MLLDEALLEFLESCVNLGLELIVERLLFSNFLENRRMRSFNVLIHFGFKRTALLHFQVIQYAVRTGIDYEHLLLHRKRRILRLLKNFRKTPPTIQLRLRRLVQLGSK